MINMVGSFINDFHVYNGSVSRLGWLFFLWILGTSKMMIWHVVSQVGWTNNFPPALLILFHSFTKHSDNRLFVLLLRQQREIISCSLLDVHRYLLLLLSSFRSSRNSFPSLPRYPSERLLSKQSIVQLWKSKQRTKIKLVLPFFLRLFIWRLHKTCWTCVRAKRIALHNLRYKSAHFWITSKFKFMECFFTIAISRCCFQCSRARLNLVYRNICELKRISFFETAKNASEEITYSWKSRPIPYK